MSKRILVFTVGLILTVASQALGQTSLNRGEVVAEVGSDKLTRTELEAGQGSALFQARYQYYLAERKALDALIEDHLLQVEAQRQHLTVAQLLEREVEQKVKTPSEEELKTYYEAIETDEPYAAIHEKLIDFIRKRRVSKARESYIKSLRSQASILIALAPPRINLPPLENTPIRGQKNAPVLMVEFADYECPYCQKVNADIKKLQEEFGDKLAVAFKDFPLPMHAHAAKAAEAARCAGAQGQFWEYHDLLFVNNKRLEIADLKGHARTLKLDPSRFDKCLDSGEQTAAVQKDAGEADSLRLTGTPSFLINGHFISGSASYDTLREIIKQQLAASEQRARVSN